MRRTQEVQLTKLKIFSSYARTVTRALTTLQKVTLINVEDIFFEVIMRALGIRMCIAEKAQSYTESKATELNKIIKLSLINKTYGHKKILISKLTKTLRISIKK